jgi:tRNA(fMet)-specific endonuclease VapC
LSLKYLLDTSTISATMGARPSRATLTKMTQREQQCALPAVVWEELSYGCARLPAGKRKDELEAYLLEVIHPAFAILPYDEAAAHWHGLERARQERVGQIRPQIDDQIAAIACVNDLILVTANTKHFKGFKDLRVEDWTSAR